mmetsp:Transcript_13981/g.56313  ORF Transcript_13981/g.56313 Transcript_13981/m.56313 type:complete len:120 (+) Transcript_13981:491-850(+)
MESSYRKPQRPIRRLTESKQQIEGSRWFSGVLECLPVSFLLSLTFVTRTFSTEKVLMLAGNIEMHASATRGAMTSSRPCILEAIQLVNACETSDTFFMSPSSYETKLGSIRFASNPAFS